MRVRIKEGVHPYSGRALDIKAVRTDRHGLVTVMVWPINGAGMRWYDRSEVVPLDDEARAALERGA